MDRFTSQDGYDFQRNSVTIDLVFTAGTSGAVPASLTYSDGIASVAQVSTTYVVTLQDGYVGMLGQTPGTVVQASYSASGATKAVVTAQAVGTSTPTITVTCYTAAGAAVAMATGDTLYMTFRLKR